MAFLLCCTFSLMLNAANEKTTLSPKNILVLASFHLSHNWTAKLTDTIRADSKNFSNPPQLTIVAFDMMRVYEPQDSEKKLLRYLSSMVQDGKFDMIVALDSPIMNLLLQNPDKVPAEIPIVFGGCEIFSPDIKQKRPNTTGVIQKDDAERTIRAGLSLYPATRTIMVLSHNSPDSRKFERDFKARASLIKGVNFVFVNNGDMTIDDYSTTLKSRFLYAVFSHFCVLLEKCHVATPCVIVKYGILPERESVFGAWERCYLLLRPFLRSVSCRRII